MTGAGRWRYGEGREACPGWEGLLEPVLDFTPAWYWPQVWRVENLELVPVESKWLGHFYGGDCYLLLYTYLIGEKPHYLLYIWQVRPHSPCPELSQLSSYPTIPLPSGHPFVLSTPGNGELTPCLFWNCFGCEIPPTLSTFTHNSFPFVFFPF